MVEDKKDIILVVDDMDVNRTLLIGLFKDKYEIMEAADGKEALAIVEENAESIVTILLDIVMPNMNGFELLDILSQRHMLFNIPVILITGDMTNEVEKKAYEYGVADIIGKPFDPYIIRKRVQNIVELYIYKNRLEHMVTDQTKILKEQTKRLKDMNIRIIDVMSTIVEFRNLEAGEHIKRIKAFTRALSRCVAQFYPEYQLTPEMINMISEASAMHDVGKIVIPDYILLKPAKLTDDEFEIMKSHTTRGCEVINAVSAMQGDEHLKYGYDICRYHHERYDGNGYPDGLKGEEIPIAAQIVSMADVYDALVSERVYKDAYIKEKAYTMIQEGECGVFSPKMLECLRIAKSEFELLADQYE